MTVSVRIGGDWIAATRRARVGGEWVPPLVDAPTVLSLWLGHTDETSVTATARTDGTTATTRLVASADAEFTHPIYSDPITPDATYYFARGTIGGLAPGTEYHIGVEVGGVLDVSRLGRAKTIPADATDWAFCLSCCSVTGSDALIFDTIRTQNADALFFEHMGDIHYDDIGLNAPLDAGAGYLPEFHASIDAVFAAPRQNLLWRNIPMHYHWDDHDYGPNNSGFSSPSRAAALTWFRTRVPAAPLALSGATDAVYYTYDVGRVRFAVLDTRSERVAGKIIGDAQEAWLIGLMEALPADMVLAIMASVPWISSSGSDTWHGATAQRGRIAAAVLENIPGRAVVLTGDMHALAYDNGTNSAGEMPVFHAGPLDQTSSLKGGPYTAGPVPGTAGLTRTQYARVEVDEIDGAVRMTFRGYVVDQSTGAQTEALTYAHTFAPSAPPGWIVSGGAGQLTITQAEAVTAPAVPTVAGGEEQLTITG